jgi:hypothetical protein
VAEGREGAGGSGDAEVEGGGGTVEEVLGERMGESVVGGRAMEQPQRKLRRKTGTSAQDSRRFLVTVDPSNG